jgi:hypothetical protein
MDVKIYLIIIFITLTSCSGQQNSLQQEIKIETLDHASYQWTRLLEEAPWEASYNFQMFNINDTLWTFHSQGNWYSIDGKIWKKSQLQNVLFNLGFLDYVVFDGSLFGLGHFEGNIEKFVFKSEIYRTHDFKKWKILAKESNLPRRFFYHPFSFNNKLWIIGGEDSHGLFADIWNSVDGVEWIKQNDSPAFGKRSSSQIVHFKDKLFLLNNDVWSSMDGLHWARESNEIIKGTTIFGYAAVVFDKKIWLLGCNRNGEFSSQVLVSENGKDWWSVDAPWTPRGGVAATVYKNRIFMSGGKYGGTPAEPKFIYSNDIWTLERKQ